MFSALKKLAAGSNKNEVNGRSPAGGLQTMHASLQKKFAKGVHYNMKIIIRGDRNVGKTCLFHRLQGKAFVEEYIPTQEIQVASIHWSYKATDDIVKVEVWDVVDKGKKKKPLEGLKLNTNAATTLPEEPALDAEFLDVYKGTHGVIMMLDITKQWTFDYVRRELPKIPTSIPVIVLANHRDMGHHRCVSEDDVRYFIEGLDRAPTDAQIRFGESSMRNSFGLKLLHKFFNLPFLALQRDSLLKQLQTNQQEMTLTNEELDLYLETDDANYDKFLDLLTQKRRQNADAVGVATQVSPSAGSTTVPIPTAHPITTPTKPVNTPSVPTVSTPSATGTSALPTTLSKQTVPAVTNSTTSNSGTTGTKPSNITSVDEFVLDGDDTNQVVVGFLSSVDEPSNEFNENVEDSDSDNENQSGNPMVMGFQDEIDDEDYLKPTQFGKPVMQISDSSSDDEVQVQQISSVPVVTSAKVETFESPTIVEDDLDDWLNGGEEETPKSQTLKPASAIHTKESTPTIDESDSEDVKNYSPSVSSREGTKKSHKKSKEKKSKRKSKRSSKDNDLAGQDASDGGEMSRSFPQGDYEEI